MKRNITKIISLILVLSLLLAVFTVLPTAEGAEAGENVKVIYNRTYEEGWDYNNGFETELMTDLGVTVTYKKVSASKYNYYMNVKALGDRGGYAVLPLGEDTPTSGKLFFELDLMATPENNMGGIVMISGMGSGTDRMLSHIVSLSDGNLYLLGENVGRAPADWQNISFVFDFDYANTEGAEDNEFLVTVSYGENTVERVYTANAGFGISDIYLGAQENLFGFDREGDEYFVDNMKVYYGTDEKTELPSNNYGTAVNTSEQYSITIKGAGGGGNTLSGQLPFDRVSDQGEDSGVQVYYHRYFSEGWDYSNGTKNNAERENDFYITTDYAADINVGSSGFINYYLQFVQRNASNGFIRLDGSSTIPSTGTVYMEFDFKASEGANIPGVMSMLTNGSPYLEFTFLAISHGDLILFDKNMGPIGEDWCHIGIVMEFGDYNYDDVDEEGNRLYSPEIIYTAFVGSEAKSTGPIVKEIEDTKSAKKGIKQIRIGKAGVLDPADTGDWWGIDNMVIYSSTAGNATEELEKDITRGFAKISPDNFGVKGSTLILTDATKDFAVDSGSEQPSLPDIMNNSLSMKVNADNMLLFGEKAKLFKDEDGVAYGGPYKDGDTVMLPIDAVLAYTESPHDYSSGGLALDLFTGGEYKALAVGRNTVEIGGTIHKLTAAPVIKTFGSNKLLFVALDDVELLFPGYYVTWDNTGFFTIAEYDNIFNRSVDESYLQSVMWSFLFDLNEITQEELYEMAKETTNNFEHPYIYVRQDRFDELYAVYHSLPTDEIFDQDLIEYIETAVARADYFLNSWALFDENGNYAGLKEGQWWPNSQGIVSWKTDINDSDPASKRTNPYTGEVLTEAGNHSVGVMPYRDSSGYDPAGGRLNVLSDGESCLAIALESAAFAYQVTHDEKYVHFAYEWTAALCEWEHWGPGHFLNCANSSRPISVSYDWLYNAYVEYGYDVDHLADRIYENGVYEGWRVVNGLPCEHLGRVGGGNSSMWTSHIGNWNPVCCLGMLTASLAVMDREEYAAASAETAYKSLKALNDRGFTYIGFDGSYRESAGYWCATSRMIIWIIETCKVALGTEFNFTDNPGLDLTDYYGCHVESNEYNRWNYHDDWEGSQETYWFFLSADVYDNPEYAAIRSSHLKNGKDAYRFDCLWYDKDLIESGQADLALDFSMESIDGYMTRAAWEPGALWAGLMGGMNNVAHGQYDSGNWVYENAGVRWFFDLGADDYNLYGGGKGAGYYKYSTLGNNVLALGSKQDTIPHGQVDAAGGELVWHTSNEHGSAAVLDMSPVYGGANNVTYARRGMLLTNDRKTVVIQDEVSMVLVENLYWFAHFNTNNVPEYELVDDRTFIMRSKPDSSGNKKTVRVNLVTANRGFKFEIWDASTENEEQFVFDATPREGYSASMNGIDEGSRKHIKKLVIAGVNTLKFDVAVVIEMIDENEPIELGYKLGWGGNANALPPMSEWLPAADTRLGVDDTVVADDAEYRPSAQLSTLITADTALSPYIQSGAYLGADREAFFRELTSIEYVVVKTRARQNTSDVIVEALAAYDEAKAKYDKFQGKIDKDTKEAASIAEGLLGLKSPEPEAPAE